MHSARMVLYFINQDQMRGRNFAMCAFASAINSSFGYPSDPGALPRAACAAARRAIGTRNGEQDT